MKFKFLSLNALTKESDSNLCPKTYRKFIAVTRFACIYSPGTHVTRPENVVPWGREDNMKNKK